MMRTEQPQIVVRVFDANGRFIQKRIVEKGNMGMWDGRDSYGRDMPNGDYLFHYDDGERELDMIKIYLRR